MKKPEKTLEVELKEDAIDGLDGLCVCKNDEEICGRDDQINQRLKNERKMRVVGRRIMWGIWYL